MPFNFCCSKPHKIKYQLNGTSSDLIAAQLAYLLWNLPEVDSYQAMHGSVFCNPVYDGYLFNLFMLEAELCEEDIRFVTDDSIINRNEAEFFLEEICVNCQKILFIKPKKKGCTKIIALFKNLRDCIAHGCFGMVEEYFIGFNHPKFEGKEYTAVFKLKYEQLYQAIETITSGDVLSLIYKEALEKNGYTIIEREGKEEADLVASKGGTIFFLDFKKYRGRYLNQTDIQRYINETRNKSDRNGLNVLVVDSTYTNSKINKYIMGENIGIVDKKYVKEMLEGRDILMEIAEKIQNNY